MSDKALTLYEPWASLVAWGVKSIETRPWRTSYRRRLWIHAAKRDDFGGLPVTSPEWRHIRNALMLAGMPCECGELGTRHAPSPIGCFDCRCLEFTPAWQLGCVLASVELVNVVPMVEYWYAVNAHYDAEVLAVDAGSRTLELWHPSLGAGNHQIGGYSDQWEWGYFAPGRFAWFLTDLERLERPVPARGRQQLWAWR